MNFKHAMEIVNHNGAVTRKCGSTNEYVLNSQGKTVAYGLEAGEITGSECKVELSELRDTNGWEPLFDGTNHFYEFKISDGGRKFGMIACGKNKMVAKKIAVTDTMKVDQAIEITAGACWERCVNSVAADEYGEYDKLGTLEAYRLIDRYDGNTDSNVILFPSFMAEY
jgi:hypothetical protein